jgi:hypothetical protein
METVADAVAEVVEGVDPESGDLDPAVEEDVAATVARLCEENPLYAED